MAKKANYTPYLESIGWKEEWLKDESLIIRVDDIKKVTNGVVFGVMEKVKAQVGEARITLFGSIYNFLSLQIALACRVIKMLLNFSKSLKKNKKLKDSKFPENKRGWYKELFIFPKTPEVNKNSDGKPAAKKPK